MGSTIYGISPAGNQPFAFLGPIDIIQVHKCFRCFRKNLQVFTWIVYMPITFLDFV